MYTSLWHRCRIDHVCSIIFYIVIHFISTAMARFSDELILRMSSSWNERSIYRKEKCIGLVISNLLIDERGMRERRHILRAVRNVELHTSGGLSNTPDSFGHLMEHSDFLLFDFFFFSSSHFLFFKSITRRCYLNYTQ